MKLRATLGVRPVSVGLFRVMKSQRTLLVCS